MPFVFLNYRRTDTAGHAGRLYDRLSERFGQERIFMDIDAIRPGDDFVARLEEVVASCDLMVALIGRDWLGTGRRILKRGRLHEPNDFVRIELHAALERGVHVIPVLVEGAPMPTPSQLPSDIAALARRQAFELSDARWRSDCDRLLAVIERRAGDLDAERASPGTDTGPQSGAPGAGSPAGAANQLAPGQVLGGRRIEEE